MFDSFVPLIYVQVSPKRLTVRNVKTGDVISEVPEVAIACKTGCKLQSKKIVGYGADARSHKSSEYETVDVVNPFAHPRSLMSDFTVGELLLKEFLRRLKGSTFFSFSPRVVMHPLGDPEGGFTQIELRALREMAIGAGASKVYLRIGSPLSDPELVACF